MTDAVFPDRITQLRARWEGDPSSRIFLQLAEEYRHMGRVREALDVLDRGLKEHPGYLSALVAKGRCHLELGEGEAARGVLERVVKQDATQMVANKLLVRAYLETGDPAKARERLDLYSLLNDSDPEIEELRRRIRLLDRPPQASSPPTGAPSPMAEADPFALPPTPAHRPEPAADIFDLGGPTGPRRKMDDVFALDETASVPVAAPPVIAPEPALAIEALEAEPEEEVDSDLFPGLASRDRRRRYLEALSAEGLFGTPAPEPTAVPSAPPPVPVADLASPIPAPGPLPTPFSAPLIEPVPVLEPQEAEPLEEEPSWLEEAAAIAPAVPPLPAPEPVDFPSFELPPPPAAAEEDLWGEEAASPWSPSAPTVEMELLPSIEPVEEPARMPQPYGEPILAAPAPPTPPAPEEPPPLPEPAPVQPPPAPEPVATATLGELYLRQGHYQEAARIFHEVLQREPGNPAALAGLERLASTPPPEPQEAPPLDAEQLLAGYRPEPQEAGPAGMRRRKIFLLNRYLERLRGNGTHVS